MMSGRKSGEYSLLAQNWKNRLVRVFRVFRGSNLIVHEKSIHEDHEIHEIHETVVFGAGARDGFLDTF